MPIREYRCENKECGLVISKIIRHNSHPPEQCPDCESKIKQIISNTAPPQFKGTGFYSTDYSNRKIK